MNKQANRSSAGRAWIRSRIRACVDASSALVGSSARISSGSSAIARDDGTLLLPARQFVRVTVTERSGQFGRLQQRSDPPPERGPAKRPVQPERFGAVVGDGRPAIQG